LSSNEPTRTSLGAISPIASLDSKRSGFDWLSETVHPRSTNDVSRPCSGYSLSVANRKAAIDDRNLAIDLDFSLADVWLLRARQKNFFTDVSESEDSPDFDRENILTDVYQAVKLSPNRADSLAERNQFIESQLNENARY
jgi:hypothetical protein